MPNLPEYATETLTALSVEQLLDSLLRDEDRAPRNVIDECATRGAAMLDRLEHVLEQGRGWEQDATPGEWWLLLHAVMILGLMPDTRAGMLLMSYLRKIEDTRDDSLEDWIGDYWAALFDNKPDDVIDALRALASDRERGWYLRSSAQDPVLASAMKNGTVDRELEWIARIAADESEEWGLRMLSAARLLDFPRERYRKLLMDLERRQKRKERMYEAREVERAYRDGVDRPDWLNRDNPWAFYEPEEIAARQERWVEVEEDEDLDDLDEIIEPYVREGPKVGRNDPCPCGSGKKYKRCCMPE